LSNSDPASLTGEERARLAEIGESSEPSRSRNCLTDEGRVERPIPILMNRSRREVSHATGLRREALLSRSCPSGVGGILSEAQVKRGRRVVHGHKELSERLGRNDLCPCDSGLLFKYCCRNSGRFRRRGAGPLRAMRLSRLIAEASRFSSGGSPRSRRWGRSAWTSLCPRS
jgi:hypothetical protein